MMLIPIAALTILGSRVISRSIKLSNIQRRMNDRIALISNGYPITEVE